MHDGIYRTHSRGVNNVRVFYSHLLFLLLLLLLLRRRRVVFLFLFLFFLKFFFNSTFVTRKSGERPRKKKKSFSNLHTRRAVHVFRAFFVTERHELMEREESVAPRRVRVRFNFRC